MENKQSATTNRTDERLQLSMFEGYKFEGYKNETNSSPSELFPFRIPLISDARSEAWWQKHARSSPLRTRSQ